MPNEEEFRRKLLATFQEEAREHLQNLASGLLSLEKSSEPQARAGLLETVFRAAHSLKGAARAVNHRGIESLCHAAEDVFARLRRGNLTATAGLFNTLHDTFDGVATLLELGPDEALPNLPALIEALTGLAAGPAETKPAIAAKSAPAEEPVHPEASGSVRLSVQAIDSLLHRAEELIHVKNDLKGFAAGLRALGAEPDGRSDREGSPVGFSSSLKKFLKHIEDRQFTDLERIDLLLDELNKILLLPCSSLFELIPKMIRDLSRGKDGTIDVEVRGGETRLDKRILDELKDPIFHLLRNAIDHGMQASAERLAAGKPARAAIIISVKPMGGDEVEISVVDDGRGIDAREVKRAALRTGVISAEAVEKLDEREALELVFRSAVSTSMQVTPVSGRGLGLAIVRDTVERLGGRVSLETSPGRGAGFHLRLPVSRSTFRGVLVGCSDQSFILPAAEVREVRRFKSADVMTPRNRPTLLIDGEPLRLIELSEALGLARTRAASDSGRGMAVIIAHRDDCAVLAVDEIDGEQEVLARPLGPQLARLRNFSGAAIVSSGRLVPVLNTADLLRGVRGLSRLRDDKTEVSRPAVSSRTILVVEDSITSRMLLKNIIEAAGYPVQTAVDGADAITMLRTGDFRLVVSDVDMPRMNGFVLTERIRADEKLKKLPVVLVTALDSREDRERGIAVGADAYILKSGFDQSSLLACLERLL